MVNDGEKVSNGACTQCALCRWLWQYNRLHPPAQRLLQAAAATELAGNHFCRIFAHLTVNNCVPQLLRHERLVPPHFGIAFLTACKEHADCASGSHQGTPGWPCQPHPHGQSHPTAEPGQAGLQLCATLQGHPGSHLQSHSWFGLHIIPAFVKFP